MPNRPKAEDAAESGDAAPAAGADGPEAKDYGAYALLMALTR